MAENAKKKVEKRHARQQRVRRTVRGTNEKPRLCVFRSLRYVYVQLISDESGAVLGAFSSKQLGDTPKGLANKVSAKQVGLRIAQIAKEQKIESVVFDRNGYLYHGRIAAVADGAREGGLKF